MDSERTLTEFEFQLMVWGYAVDGLGDVSVKAIERDYAREMTTWDEDSDYLDTVLLSGERPPDKFALWWVCEHERRHDNRQA